MSRRRKSFPCGHSGLGQYCHRCRTVERLDEARVREKSVEESKYQNDPINLRGFPQNVVNKAREVISKLQNGTAWGELKGKRLQHDRSIISVPVTRDYRLICKYGNDGLKLKRLESHEDYNVAKPGL